jgi:hypothetical protein
VLFLYTIVIIIVVVVVIIVGLIFSSKGALLGSVPLLISQVALHDVPPTAPDGGQNARRIIPHYSAFLPFLTADPLHGQFDLIDSLSTNR